MILKLSFQRKWDDQSVTREWPRGPGFYHPEKVRVPNPRFTGQFSGRRQSTLDRFAIHTGLIEIVRSSVPLQFSGSVLSSPLSLAGWTQTCASLLPHSWQKKEHCMRSGNFNSIPFKVAYTRLMDSSVVIIVDSPDQKIHKTWEGIS